MMSRGCYYRLAFHCWFCRQAQTYLVKYRKQQYFSPGTSHSIHVPLNMESQSKSSAKCSNFGPKSSWIFSSLSLLLIVALFIRMEAINNKTVMNEMRISKVESNMKIMTFQATDDDEEMGSLQDSKKKLASVKVRRSLIPASNSSLSIDDLRREINKHIKQLKPQSLCTPSEKVCVQGPPGKKGSRGSRGSRGRRGAPGDKGKKGAQGIMGPSGRHGKQGMVGDPGIKGEKGEKGAAGPRGMTGLKGDPGESSISIPEVIVSPDTKTVNENQTATFYCSVSGNPQPTVTWTKVKGSLARSHINQSGILKITHSTFNDSGDYKCTAVNILGQDEKIAKLIVEVGPRLIIAPDRFLLITEEEVASLTCEAFSYPPSVVTWTRALAALPKGRSSVSNGTLTIQDFSIGDTGIYICTARNKLGSVTALTTLGFQRKIADSCTAVSLSKHSASGTYELKVNSIKFEVYCDITSQGTSWTLIARFSNNDGKTWMQDDGLWWYDQNVTIGTTTDPSVNADMISSAFWLVSGREFKITRSDDSSHTPLLQTTGNCLGGQTFRSKITSYGDFRNGKVWSSDQCLGSCTVQYGGQYKTTHGFEQAACSSNIQNSNKIGFWCDWDDGDGSVMMIGGGGKDCARADHGIGITETGAASFVDVGTSETEYDFGYDANTGNAPSQSYSLNLWIR